MKKISVIIPTYNLKNDVLKCIESIKSQTYKDIEIIVIDNASVDGTADAIAKKYPKVKLIRNKENEGVTGAANKGVKITTGDYVCFVDHDMILDKNMMKHLVDALEADKTRGIVVGKILYQKNKKLIWAAGTGINLITGKIFFRKGKDVGQFEKVEEVQVAPANFMLKKSLIKKYGAYDPIYIIGYEDTDISFRMKNAGYKVVYIPQAISYHNIPVTTEGNDKRLLERSYWVGRNRVIFMKKWGNFPAFLIFLFPLTLYYFVLSMRYRKPGSFIQYLKGTKEGFLA